ncbi:MAG: PadR family transcriptional regulator PadR [Rhodothermales bacterium]|jgi:PadR family transcriptional regulator PadR
MKLGLANRESGLWHAAVGAKTRTSRRAAVVDLAYGLSIREEVQKATGKEWTLGALYAPLRRLENKQWVSSRYGKPETRRGGRSKVYYELTDQGKHQLIHVKSVHDAQWAGIHSLVIDLGSK